MNWDQGIWASLGKCGAARALTHGRSERNSRGSIGTTRRDRIRLVRGLSWLGLLAFSFNVLAWGQPVHTNPPPCDPYDIEPPLFSEVCIELEDAGIHFNVWEQTIRVENKVTDTTPWVGGEACDCRYVRPGDLPVRPCVPNTLTESVTKEICWQASGGIEHNYRVGVAHIAVVEVGASQHFNNSVQHCVSSTQSQTIQEVGTQCWTHYRRGIKFTRQAEVERWRYPVVRLWICWRWDPPPSFNVVRVTCGAKEEYVATASNDYFITTEQTDYPSRPCHWFPSDEDLSELRYSTPCCRPLRECDTLAPGQRPCCGVENEQ